MIDNSEFRGALNYLRSRYEILGLLGRDGPGVVYRGYDLTMRREVAIRLRRLPSGANSMTRLVHEVDLLAQVWHPNIVALYALHEIPDRTVATIMQFGSWQALSEVIHRVGPLPVAQARDVLRDVATALIQLHDHGLVHQSVRPSNIFLDDESGRALLSDFAIEGEDEGRDAEPTQPTVGAFVRLSSREIDRSRTSRKRDLVGLGLVGYEMLLGGRTGEVTNSKLPSLATIRSDVPEELREAIERAVHGNRVWRYPSVDTFLAQLEPKAESAEYTRLPECPALSAAVVLRDNHPVEVAAVQRRRPRVLVRSGVGAAVMLVAFILLSSPRFPAYRRSESLPSVATAVLPITPAEPPRVSGAAPERRAAPVEPSRSAPVTSTPVKSAPVKSAPAKSAPVPSAPVKSAPVTSRPEPRPQRAVSTSTEPPESRDEDPTPARSKAAPQSNGPVRRVDPPTRAGALRLVGSPVLLGDPSPLDNPDSPGGSDP